MSTRSERPGQTPAAERLLRRATPADQVALVARARRDLLLRAHRFRLRREDLEDCYSQATLELITRALRGATWASIYRAGIRAISEIVRDNPLAQDYVGWGDPGPGRWVTIYATVAPTPHVFIVVAGLRLDTSHAGTDVGPNRAEGGPRWRLFGHIPTWAHWSVRHPPGL
ncbi:MAG TPA: hypothetical protein VGN08_06880 [Solirubrobacteraceae bacterium]